MTRYQCVGQHPRFGRARRLGRKPHRKLAFGQRFFDQSLNHLVPAKSNLTPLIASAPGYRCRIAAYHRRKRQPARSRTLQLESKQAAANHWALTGTCKERHEALGVALRETARGVVDQFGRRLSRARIALRASVNASRIGRCAHLASPCICGHRVRPNEPS